MGRRWVAWFFLVVSVPFAGAALEVEPKERASGGTEVFGLHLGQVELGLGLGNYTGDGARDLGAGSAWNVRAGLDVSQPLDIEISYIGGMNSIEHPGLRDFNVYTNGLQAGIRIDPYVINDRITPYVSGGIGMTRMSVAKNPELSPEFQSDTAGAFPVAIGADYSLGKKLALGARAQWDVMFDNELVVDVSNGNTDRVGFLIQLGATGF